MTAARQASTLVRGAAAAVVLAGLVVGVPVLLVATIGNPIPDQSSWDGPLTNTTILQVIACVAWIFWAQLTACVLVELAAEIRLATGRSADWLHRIPGTFGGQQTLARTLVQAVLAVGITTQVATAGATPWTAPAEAAPAVPPRPSEARPAAVTEPAASARSANPTKAAPTTIPVQRGDTLWSIAETHLGAGERWREIADLNQGRQMPDGTTFRDTDTLLPSWTLLIPDEAHGPTRAHEITVEPGDTLWDIAQEEYDDPLQWPLIHRANQQTIDDPDLIYPGQRLRIPAPQDDSPSPDRPGLVQPPQVEPPSNVAPRAPAPPAEPSPEPAPPETQPISPDVPAARAENDGEDDSAFHIDGADVLRALLGGGGVMAAGLLAVFIGRRRTQSRFRQLGRLAHDTPPALAANEKAVRVVGTTGADTAAFINSVLRELAHRAEHERSPLPDAAAARIDSERFDLHLNPPNREAPAPWLASPDGETWSISRQHTPEQVEHDSPYPALVTIGDDDNQGTWFIDLEAAGAVQVTGDPVVSSDVLRFIAAELALNAWADAEDVTVFGVAEEVAELHGRIGTAPTPRIDQLAKEARNTTDIIQSHGSDVLTRRVADGGRDAWMPIVHIARIRDDHAAAASADTTAYLDQLERADGRTATVLLAAALEVLDDRATTLTAGSDGTLTTPWARVHANRLTADEAAAIVELFEDADVEDDEPIPAATQPDGTPAETNAAGALDQSLTEPRDVTGDPDSLLPRPDKHYLAATATTAEDLAELAPSVPKSDQSQEIATDPTLDDDLADWHDPACTRPKLRVVGPIELHAAGERAKEVESRPAYFAELAAYLASHPEGATPDQMATDFGLQRNSLHTRIGLLRKWLGKLPGTDDWHLPEATHTRAGKTRGIPVYQIDGLLCDADLFRRLRARAQARGPHGIDDLRQALDLARGRPFDQPRPGGYRWLVDTPTDHYITAAIVDVGHLLATHALAEGNPRLAAWAAEKAINAAPSEDPPRLDLARAKAALGDTGGARKYIDQDVFNRTDDDRPPLEPSQRTMHVLDRGRDDLEN